MLIDTHTHLNFSAFDSIVNQVVNEAVRAGITTMIVPGAKLGSSTRAIKLAQEHQSVYAAVGIHPIHSSEIINNRLSIFKKLKSLAQNNKVVAIGECGLDYFHQPVNKKNQKEMFAMQIKLAQKLKLPLIIHNRAASDDILSILSSNTLKLTNSKLVFHSFEGQVKIWQFIKDKPNMFIGINGLITYHPKLKNIISQIPINKIVLETDSPYLRPRLTGLKLTFPNTPENVKIVALCLAKIKNCSVNKINRLTTQNAKKIFQI